MASHGGTSTIQPGSAQGRHFLIVEARYYDDLADALLAGARAALEAAGASFAVVTVPGALEIPAAIAMARSGNTSIDGYIALGCVIRGETGHYDIVAGESARGLMDIAIDRRMPLGNGILTVETDAQAQARAAVSGMNKGAGAAEAALAVLRLKRRLLAEAEGS